MMISIRRIERAVSEVRESHRRPKTNPHPFLRHFTAPSVVVMLLLVLFVAKANAQSGGTSTTVSGHNLTSVDVYDGANKTGVIRQKSAGQWEWVEGGQSHPWREVRRTDTSVFLSDQQSYVELNIPQGGIFGSDREFRTGDRYYLLKNPVGNKGTTFDGPWYRTVDQNNDNRIHILAEDQIGKRTQFKKTQASMHGYYFPRMHPYKLRFTGTKRKLDLFDSVDEYAGNADDFWPSIFFMERDGSGRSKKSGKVFFSESSRQKAWETSASVEAGGFGVSVGLKGDYGENEASSEGSESMSVVATSHQANYWLWLNKRKVRLNSKFVEKVMAMTDPEQFMEDYGSHYPLAVLYGGRAMYDETVVSEEFSKSISNHWSAGASASGSAFGFDAAVSASYGENSSGNRAGGSTLSEIEVENIGGVTPAWPIEVTDENSYPIKVVLKPIHELIRPELFEGHAQSQVLEKQRLIEQAFLKLVSENKRPEGDISEALWPKNAGLTNAKNWKPGTPIMFSWFFENVTNLESINRNDVVISKHPKVANAYIARLTIIPEIKGSWFKGKWSGYYDYDSNLKCRLRVTFANGRQATLNFEPFGTAARPVTPYIATTYPISEVGGYPKYAPTRSELVNGIEADKGVFTEFFQEAPLTKTEEGQIELPSAPWLRRR